MCVSVRLSVCLTDSCITFCSSCTFCSFKTQWSVSVPKLYCYPSPNHCHPASCILRGTLPSIMRSSRGLGTGCQSMRVFVCAYETVSYTSVYCGSVCAYETECVCTHNVCMPVFICTQMGSSIRSCATTIQE